jgi:DNA-3-methyladenine glycosylase II
LSAVDVERDAEFHAALTAVSGIGPWTADIFLLACLGRPDAFPTGDLALQVAAQHAFELDRHPTAAELLDLAEDWRPWRSVSARLLWAYYQVVKDTKSGMPV